MRDQYHHATDVAATVLDVAGLEMPEEYKGIKQYPLNGVSMRYSFDDQGAPTTRKRQYFAMLGTRGIWQDGWKAAALHAPISNKGNFDQDRWELYHVAEDRSESTNVAEQYPDKLKELIDAWFEEAKNNFVLPLDDRSAVEQAGTPRPQSEPPRDRYLYYPDTAPVPEGVAVSIRGRYYKIVANVDLATGCRGRDLRARLPVRRAHDVHQGRPAALRLQLPGHQAGAGLRLPAADRPVSTHWVWSSSGRRPASTASRWAPQCSTSTASRWRTGRCAPRSASSPWPATVCASATTAATTSPSSTRTPGTFTGGTIQGVAFDVSEKAYVDLNRDAEAAFATD